MIQIIDTGAGNRNVKRIEMEGDRPLVGVVEGLAHCDDHTAKRVLRNRVISLGEYHTLKQWPRMRMARKAYLSGVDGVFIAARELVVEGIEAADEPPSLLRVQSRPPGQLVRVPVPEIVLEHFVLHAPL